MICKRYPSYMDIIADNINLAENYTINTKLTLLVIFRKEKFIGKKIENKFNDEI